MFTRCNIRVTGRGSAERYLASFRCTGSTAAKAVEQQVPVTVNTVLHTIYDTAAVVFFCCTLKNTQLTISSAVTLFVLFLLYKSSALSDLNSVLCPQVEFSSSRRSAGQNAGQDAACINARLIKVKKQVYSRT